MPIDWNGQAEPPMRRKTPLRVYIAGPLTLGLAWRNVREAVRVGLDVRKLGHIPFIPHLYMFVDMMFPQDERFWMDLDIAWVEACDCVIRLPGESSGADEEIVVAADHGIPVFHGIESFVFWALVESEHTKAVVTELGGVELSKKGNGKRELPPPEAMHGAADGFPGQDYLPDPPLPEKREEWLEFSDAGGIALDVKWSAGNRFDQLAREITLITNILANAKWVAVPTKALQGDGTPGKVRYYVEGMSDSVTVVRKSVVIALREVVVRAAREADEVRTKGLREKLAEQDDLLRHEPTT